MRAVAYAAIGAGAALLALEATCRLLPVATSSATGYYFDPLILTYPSHHRFQAASGWDLARAQRLQANNYGFIADHDFAPNPHAIALIGDSFVEASMLASSDRLGAQLERRTFPRPVYAMGSPGTALLDYAERMRFASEKFGIHDFVLLLEHGDIAQSLCGSGNIHAQCLDRQTLQPRIELQTPPGRLKRLLRKFALPQYLFSQLKLDPQALLRRLIPGFHRVPGTPEAPHSAQLPSAVAQRVLAEFFARTRPWRTGRLILVWIGQKAPDPLEQDLVHMAALHGATVVKSAAALQDLARRTGLSPYVSPRDAHLNGAALGLIADEIAAAMPHSP